MFKIISLSLKKPENTSSSKKNTYTVSWALDMLNVDNSSQGAFGKYKDLYLYGHRSRHEFDDPFPGTIFGNSPASSFDSKLFLGDSGTKPVYTLYSLNRLVKDEAPTRKPKYLAQLKPSQNKPTTSGEVAERPNSPIRLELEKQNGWKEGYLKPGDEIFHSKPIHHSAIYIGGDKIIEVNGNFLKKMLAGVIKPCDPNPDDSFDILNSQLNLKYRFNKGHGTMYSGEEVARRAKDKVGTPWEYCMTNHNCQHFTRWCVTGKKLSFQMEEFAEDVRHIGRVIDHQAKSFASTIREPQNMAKLKTVVRFATLGWGGVVWDIIDHIRWNNARREISKHFIAQ